MNGELIRLKAFLDTWDEIDGTFLRPSDFDDSKAFLQQSVQNIHRLIERTISELHDSLQVTHFVQSLQTELTSMADKADRQAFLHQSLPFYPENENHLPVLLRELNSRTVHLLEYLHIYYAAHFNPEIPLPGGFLQLNASKSEQQRLNLIGGLTERKIEDRLIALLDSHLSALEGKGHHRIGTWKLYDYLYDLTFELGAFLKGRVSEDETLRLIMLLIAYDFNHIEFYTYMLKYTENSLSLNASYEEQLIAVSSILLKFENIRMERREGYNPRVASLRESVCGSLKKKLKHLKRLQRLYIPKDEKEKKHSWFYFSINSTIEELMFMLWVMLEVRFMKTKFHTHVYAFVENHIKTDDTNRPSPAYMRNHFGNKDVPAHVVRRVRDWLQRMIWFIDEKFKDKLKRY